VQHSHLLDHNSSSSNRSLAHLIDLHKDLMHREDGVWGLLQGVPSGHRVPRELTQQELTSRDLSRPQPDHQDPHHKPPEYRLEGYTGERIRR
ncbi:hypothetical protein KI387_026440, partial [Taxus chinensis]